MNWFQRHVNLSLGLYFFAGIIVTTILVPNLAHAHASFEVFLLYLLVLLGLLFLLDAWVLRQKGRSLYFLFFLLLGIGVAQIIYLCLSNNKQEAIDKALEQTA